MDDNLRPVTFDHVEYTNGNIELIMIDDLSGCAAEFTFSKCDTEQLINYLKQIK